MRLFASLALLTALLSPAFADDSAKMREIELDKLFGSLHQASATQDTRKIEADIWALWAIMIVQRLSCSCAKPLLP